MEKRMHKLEKNTAQDSGGKQLKAKRRYHFSFMFIRQCTKILKVSSPKPSLSVQSKISVTTDASSVLAQCYDDIHECGS